MRILLDTNMLLRAVAGRSALPPTILNELRDSENEVLFCSASIWEIGIKFALRKPGFEARPATVLAMARDIGLVEQPVTGDLAVGVAVLPHVHSDPFDRLIVALAIALPARLYTTDRKLAGYPALVTVVG